MTDWLHEPIAPIETRQTRPKPKHQAQEPERKEPTRRQESTQSQSSVFATTPRLST